MSDSRESVETSLNTLYEAVVSARVETASKHAELLKIFKINKDESARMYSTVLEEVVLLSSKNKMESANYREQYNKLVKDHADKVSELTSQNEELQRKLDRAEATVRALGSPMEAEDAPPQLTAVPPASALRAHATRAGELNWSWCIEGLHISTVAIKRSAIVGCPTGEVWARSEGANEFAGTADELATLVKAFDELYRVHERGLDLEGTHYIVPRTEENLIFGKKDRTGFFAVKTAQTVIIAVYEGACEIPFIVLSNIEKITKFLADNGF